MAGISNLIFYRYHNTGHIPYNGNEICSWSSVKFGANFRAYLSFNRGSDNLNVLAFGVILIFLKLYLKVKNKEVCYV